MALNICYKNNPTECTMLIHIMEAKGKYWSENSALCQGISNWKSAKHAVVDWRAAANSIFMVFFVVIHVIN